MDALVRRVLKKSYTNRCTSSMSIKKVIEQFLYINLCSYANGCTSLMSKKKKNYRGEK